MRRLLVIEPGTGPDPVDIRSILLSDEVLSCDFVPCPAVRACDLVNGAEDLIVLAAIRDLPRFAGLLEELSAHAVPAPIMAVVPQEGDAAFLDLVSRVADDFIAYPFNPAELRLRIRRILARPEHDVEAVRRRLVEEIGFGQLVGRDPAFVQAISQLPRFARSDAAVCVTGETGTGKELCARALHHLSRRQRFPFIAVDCGALPDQLFENEVFGHARGAFTDAHRDHKGLVGMAEGGTLFLDEVDALSLAAQAKLLRFLQERTYRALGSDRFETADLRVVTATNRDLEECVRERQFRSDLYFRLNVLRLRLPPLRERGGDIELLACAALKEHAEASAAGAVTFSPAALRMLSLHRWPGNVRELFNVVQRAAVACDGDRVLPEHLDLPCPGGAESAGAGNFRSERAAVVAAFERRFVEELLRKHNGNVTQAAREANQDRRAFGRYIKKYKIDRRSMTA